MVAIKIQDKVLIVSDVSQPSKVQLSQTAEVTRGAGHPCIIHQALERLGGLKACEEVATATIATEVPRIFMEVAQISIKSQLPLYQKVSQAAY